MILINVIAIVVYFLIGLGFYSVAKDNRSFGRALLLSVYWPVGVGQLLADKALAKE